jgi:hypothetical protein
MERFTPHISIEGEEFFAKRDALATAGAPAAAAPGGAAADGPEASSSGTESASQSED